MWALVIAFLSVGGLMRFAYGQKMNPSLKISFRKAKLRLLATTDPKKMTIDQAEDGVVLAREFHTPELERKFKLIAAKLKSKR